MKTNHTPGPWKVGKGRDTAKNHAVCAGASIVAKVNGLGYPLGEGWSPESEANARLIAAAPDMLEACETALANLSPLYSSEHLVIKRLSAAIAKANGHTVN